MAKRRRVSVRGKDGRTTFYRTRNSPKFKTWVGPNFPERRDEKLKRSIVKEVCELIFIKNYAVYSGGTHDWLYRGKKEVRRAARLAIELWEKRGFR